MANNTNNPTGSAPPYGGFLPSRPGSTVSTRVGKLVYCQPKIALPTPHTSRRRCDVILTQH